MNRSREDPKSADRSMFRSRVARLPRRLPERSVRAPVSGARSAGPAGRSQSEASSFQYGADHAKCRREEGSQSQGMQCERWVERWWSCPQAGWEHG
ncbi:hypothetical protein SKAU_G00084710 [Synaphobranchus kaupii]|uniref:Uncharacterized protein n=1 Tax=Synaphobranchus kaupii TaxID=118154 RepID=A0A9Q1FWC4_SYNKA|nr:hypothetical protein SKAU_G00084710 [Synaphobranchus kaupii]